MVKQVCKGLKYDYKSGEISKCTSSSKPNSDYCGNHKYFADFTSPENARICKKCRKFVDYGDVGTLCNPCNKRKDVDNAKKKQKKLANRCVHYDRNKKPCEYQRVKNSEYCKHHDYMETYTEEQKKHLKQCTGGCKQFKYLGGSKTCDKCRNREKPKKEIIQCDGITKKGTRCPVSANFTFENKAYCILHHDIAKLVSEGFKSCSSCGRYNIKEGTRCGVCRNLESNRSKKKTDDDMKNAISCAGISENSTYCPYCENTYPYDKFIENGDEVLSCTNCREKQPSDDLKLVIMSYNKMVGAETFYNYTKNDLVRLEMQYKKTTMNCTKCKDTYLLFKDSQNRPCLKYCLKCYTANLVRERNRKRIKYYKRWDSSEKRKKSRAIWRENNYEKVAYEWIKSRKNKIAKLGIEEYRHQGAVYADKWREKNPDKQRAILDRAKLSKSRRISSVVHSAYLRGIGIDDNDEFRKFAETLLDDVCFYCGEVEEGSINGIDRVDSDGKYTEDNCVSCCKVCNYMKGELTYTEFVKKIEHICWYQKLCDMAEPQWEYCLTNHKPTSYKAYKKRATDKKKIEFSLTKDDYTKLIIQDCYICGRKAGGIKNGLDRVNNNEGYTHDNVKSCCSQCNYIKRTYSLEKMYDKCLKIYTNTIKKIEDDIETNISSGAAKSISSLKMSKEYSDDEIDESVEYMDIDSDSDSEEYVDESVVYDSDSDDDFEYFMDAVKSKSTTSSASDVTDAKETKSQRNKRYRETQKNKRTDEENRKYERERKARQRTNKRILNPKPKRQKPSPEEKRKKQDNNRKNNNDKMKKNVGDAEHSRIKALEASVSRYNRDIRLLEELGIKITDKQKKSLKNKKEKRDIQKKELDDLRRRYK